MVALHCFVPGGTSACLRARGFWWKREIARYQQFITASFAVFVFHPLGFQARSLSTGVDLWTDRTLLLSPVVVAAAGQPFRARRSEISSKSIDESLVVHNMTYFAQSRANGSQCYRINYPPYQAGARLLCQVYICCCFEKRMVDCSRTSAGQELVALWCRYACGTREGGRNQR